MTSKEDYAGTNCPAFKPDDSCAHTAWGCCPDGKTIQDDVTGENCPGVYNESGFVSSDCCMSISQEREDCWCKANCFNEDGSYLDECDPLEMNRTCDCLCPDKSIRNINFIVAH